MEIIIGWYIYSKKKEKYGNIAQLAEQAAVNR